MPATAAAAEAYKRLYARAVPVKRVTPMNARTANFDASHISIAYSHSLYIYAGAAATSLL